MAIFKRNPKNTTTTTVKRERSERPTTTTNKRVTFVDKALIGQPVEEDIMYENKTDIWFSRHEEANFKERDIVLAMLLQQMDPAEVEIRVGESSRGLEFANKQCGLSILDRRHRSVTAVVATQQRLLFVAHKKKKNNATKADDQAAGDLMIAQAYSAVCNRAVEIARERAEMDQKFVADHVRVAEQLENRTFERRAFRPSVLGRQIAQRSVISSSVELE